MRAAGHSIESIVRVLATPTALAELIKLHCAGWKGKFVSAFVRARKLVLVNNAMTKGICADPLQGDFERSQIASLRD